MARIAWWWHQSHNIAYVDELPSAERLAFDREIRIRYHRQSNPVSKLWCESTKPRLNPEALRYIDNLLAKPG